MLDASPELLELWASSTFFSMADCFTITPLWGMPPWPAPQSLFYNDSPFDFQMAAGEGFPRFKSGRILCSNITNPEGLEVGECDLICHPGPDDLIGTEPWMNAAALNGQLVGAAVLIQQAFFTAASMPYPVGAITIFKGAISDQDPLSGMIAQFKAKNLLERFNHKWPRNLYGPSCHWRVYTDGCGANRASFTVSGVVGAGYGSSTKWILTDSLSQPDGYFNLGVIGFTSGPNAGARRTVKSFRAATSGPGPSTPAVIEIILPLLYATGADDFEIYPGCDGAQSTCIDKFNRFVSYKATPNVPPTDAVT